jgi:Spy/CpxP family protein refolding chaperone
MKKQKALMFAALLALGGATVMRADEKPQAGQMEKSRGEWKDMWKEKLGLSDDQSKKMKAAFESHKATFESLRAKRKDAMSTLKNQVEKKASDADIKSTLDSIQSIDSSMKAEHEKLRAETDAILTPTQRAKMLIGRNEHMKKAWEGHMHGMGDKDHGMKKPENENEEDGPGDGDEVN